MAAKKPPIVIEPAEPMVVDPVDPRTFAVRRNGRAAQLAIHRQNVATWAPNASVPNTTLVTLEDGKTMQVNCRFREFHAWVIAPALERDKKLKDTITAKKEANKAPPPKARKPRAAEELISA